MQCDWTATTINGLLETTTRQRPANRAQDRCGLACLQQQQQALIYRRHRLAASDHTDTHDKPVNSLTTNAFYWPPRHSLRNGGAKHQNIPTRPKPIQSCSHYSFLLNAPFWRLHTCPAVVFRVQFAAHWVVSESSKLAQLLTTSTHSAAICAHVCSYAATVQSLRLRRLQSSAVTSGHFEGERVGTTFHC